MNIKNRSAYYLLILAFPVFFILHGINENFALISVETVGRLSLYYLGVTAVIAFLCLAVVKEYRNAFVASFALLLFFFFFGVFKDFAKTHSWLDQLTSYKVVLPAILLISVAILLLLRKARLPLTRISSYLSSLILIVFAVELILLIIGIITHKERKSDFGDVDNDIAKSITNTTTARKPVVFWIVFDEYSGQTALMEKWNFDNPVDTILRNEGFFVADSAISNYNYTHYSLTSTLDMTYLPGFRDRAVITYRDAQRGHYSLRRNNTVEIFRKYGYEIENFTLYDLEHYPSKGYKLFEGGDFLLIDNQTLPGRLKMDIGWNFRHLFAKDKQQKDAVRMKNALMNIATERDQLLNKCLSAANKRRNNPVPTFFMYHFMYTHEPFLYGDNDSLSLNTGFRTAPAKYVASVKVANNAIKVLVDSIKKMYAGRELVIIIQGDHGFKFDDVGPLFQKESCSILYAVYCSDGDYGLWYNTISSVNGFRFLFNKYFNTLFAKLPDRSYFLNYQ